MNLKNTITGERLSGTIEKIGIYEIQKLKNHKNFLFDWTKEKENMVYKITFENEMEILGLISLIDVSDEFRVHLNLIESSKMHRGKNKTIENIPGCLIAFACRLAFEKGYDGFVSLTPKTKLINYYTGNYGFRQMGRMLAVFGETSNSLISKYFDDEEI